MKAKRILGAIPFSWSFAMRTLPPGVSVRVPADLGELIVTTAKRPADGDAKELERSLAKILWNESDRLKAKAALRNTARHRLTSDDLSGAAGSASLRPALEPALHAAS